MKKKTKLIFGSIAGVILIMAAIVVILFHTNRPAKTQDIAENYGFHVQGTTLYDAEGNPFVIRGINIPYAWYTDKLDVMLDGVQASGANSVRVVLADGVQWPKTTAEEIRTIIDGCKERSLICILEVHDATGRTKEADLLTAAEYFASLSEVLSGEEAYVIINIANEWGPYSGQAFGKAYEKAIGVLRDAGLMHTIMVDAGGYGQFGRTIGIAGSRILESDPLQNTMFSVHMYGFSGGSENAVKRNIDFGLKNNLCICVGEFGYTHSDGDVKEEYVMRYCEENSVGYMPWSYKGNSGGVEYLDLYLDWEGLEPSPDWGVVAIEGENGIRSTSRICSVYR